MKSMITTNGKYLFIALICNCFLSTVSAQTTEVPVRNWTFKTRVVMTGSSDHSDPDGYMVYSAISIEPSITRKISKIFSIELSVKSESHEVDILKGDEDGKDLPIGSVELLPVNCILRYSFKTQSEIHPYVGGGVNATFCWEKSGDLNSSDLTPGFGPAVQIGCDYYFNEQVLFNINIGWNKLKTDIKYGNSKAATLSLDPLSLGIGLGFNF
jgi:outer membrane protein